MLTPSFTGDPDYAPMWAGMSCSRVNDIKPAGQIVGELVAVASAELSAT
jgi:hypothetical protein